MLSRRRLAERYGLEFIAVLAASFMALTAGVTAEPAPTGSAPARKPAVYFCDFNVDKYDSAVMREFLEAGFEVDKNRADFPDYRWLLTWDEMKQFNVIAIVGTPTVFSETDAALLDRYMSEGGGVLWMPMKFPESVKSQARLFGSADSGVLFGFVS